jgi:hypothetical protein
MKKYYKKIRKTSSKQSSIFKINMWKEREERIFKEHNVPSFSYNYSDKEKESLNKFLLKHKNCLCVDLAGAKYTYVFIPNGLGMDFSIKCNICGKIENLTDADCW